MKGHIKFDGICKEEDVRSFKRARTNHVGQGSETNEAKEDEEEEEGEEASGDDSQF